MAKLNDCPKFDPNENDYYTTKQMWENISIKSIKSHFLCSCPKPLQKPK